ncbi:MAG: cell division protein ZapD [Gammaproteobacteria bacterium]|nr:cell division protein ZapD [Gammaproteobacteria bacterium]
MPDQTVFEHPLNEKCRTWLRLSHLFEQFEFHRPQAEEWHARAAVSALLDIANVLARADIKSELLKELDRYRQSLGRMADSPGVDTERLRQILEHLGHSCEGVRDVSGQLGQALRGNEFLSSIVQRSSIAGGSFDFDLPQYHYWLQMPQAERATQLDAWRNEVTAVQDAVTLLLGLIRSSAVPSEEHAVNGFYQQSLPGNVAAQLVRVGVPSSAGMFAEISGGKHRFSVRFLDCADWQHPAQIDSAVPFSLSVCMI